MAENFKHLYQQTKIILEMYQDEIVPGLREQLEKRVQVVRCKDCKSYFAFGGGYAGVGGCMIDGRFVSDDFYCKDGERKDDGKNESK